MTEPTPSDVPIADAIVQALREQFDDQSSAVTGLELRYGVGEFGAAVRGEIDLFRLAHAIERELQTTPARR